MTFLPIVDRELRIRARWRSTYWVRALFATIAISIAIVMTLFAAVGLAAVGGTMLRTLAWMTFAFCVVEGFRHTADCLSEEKREGTLGLLFLTDLKGYDVVLGKFAATSLSSFYGLIAVIPALAMPVMLGGVTGAEFWRVVLALINALFFSLCAGMLVSSLSRNERRAWTAAALVVIVFVALLPVLGAVLKRPHFAVFSPTTALLTAFEPQHSANPGSYWAAVWIPHLLGWAFLVLASFVLPRVWQEGGAAQRAQRPRVITNPQQALRRRRELLAINPVWWLTARNERLRVWLWSIVVTASAAGLGVWILGEGDGTVAWSLFGLALLLHFFLCVWMASEACYSFADARSSGAMEVLLSTPLSVRQILRGQHLALKHLFLGPVVFLLSAEFLILCAQLYVLAHTGQQAFGRVMIIVVVGFSFLWFALDLLAVSHVGMWFGLTSAKPTQALTKTVLFTLVLPLIFVPCSGVLGPGLMVAKSVIFFTWAQSKLENEFRRAATERFDQRADWWRRRGPPKLRMPEGGESLKR